MELREVRREVLNCPVERGGGVSQAAAGDWCYRSSEGSNVSTVETASI